MSGGGDGDREAFFHCLDRVPSGIHLDADFPSDDDDDDDVRVSFASAMGDQSFQSFRRYQTAVLEEEDEEQEEAEDPSKYDMWMSDEPMSIQERRRRLHQGLGMASSRDLALRRHSMKKRPADMPRSMSRSVSRQLTPASAPIPPAASAANAPSTAAAQPVAAAPQPAKKAITRRRSDSDLVARDGASVSGKPPSPPLRRVRSLPARHDARDSAPLERPQAVASRELPVVPLPATSPADKGGKGDGGDGKKGDADGKKGDDGDKNQDSEKEAAAAVAATPKDASSNTQTGVLGLEEFEKFIGNTPIMKLMRRGTSQHQPAPPSAGVPPKAEKAASKKKGGWLKNIKSVAIGFMGDKDTNAKATASTAASTVPKSLSTNASAAGAAPPASSSERLKVHQYGKSSKELTGLYMCQEILAHEGSIWSIKFSADGRWLASAGEDSVVRVWQVVETNAPPSSLALDGKSGPLAPLPPVPGDGSSTTPALSKKSTKGKSGRDALPEHLVIPDKVFALAEQPACVLEGHKDDVLDLTWSKSDQLLSSSMDKTVRLWDTESKACLKTFTHSDYVTCIQFNPVDDRYFISGSLDAKVRLWSIPDRQVVDWTDLNEMVTAASYTPDGQGVIIGSHKGSCRLYKTTGCKLSAEAQIDIQTKKRKAQAKKITGFQFAPGNPAEVLVTSADSQIRVFDGVTMVQKFRGFKNTSSQITAAYTSDGRYAVCASEDSHVYLWRTTRVPPAAAIGIGMKPKTWCTIRSYENFYCKDVSAAVPWTHSPSPPGSGDGSPSGGSPASRDKQQQQGASCNDESCSVAAKPEGGEPGGGKGDSGNAWGLVVVTASLGGEIRVYQNFGMPFRIKGQGNLFY
ncbi:hypothetical protein SETIT_7G283800v2 [Setaria italica]|uniref:Anaphase-promoting complex subunit 4 WD40 domain-containing protein n=1 Tax=Setaria italica TaxID=4555 RepID=A0A368S2D0_SETIT|nr:WD repeat-containing protein 44 [Setaria italica]RCV35990.1 hypothetical protein SETIT_7G283800v2 [Setaria italica]